MFDLLAPHRTAWASLLLFLRSILALFQVGEAGDYTTTIYAHHGMAGTDLPPLDTGVQWKVGTSVEVTWQIENHHGGGYSYRLCPADQNLTEACFQQHQLDFVEDAQGIVFPNGTVVPVQGTFIRDGTFPVGSHWALIPSELWVGGWVGCWARCLGEVV